MYKSPITIIESTMDSIYKDIAKKKDDAIFAEIQCSFGVDMDRDELIRALQYDRNQYEKGYWDGMADAKAELVRCKNCDWYREHEDSICVNPKCGKSWYGCPVPPEHFCSYGERKE